MIGKRYALVTSTELGFFLRQIDDLMADGWVCVGGVSVAMDGSDGFVCRYAQALVRQHTPAEKMERTNRQLEQLF